MDKTISRAALTEALDLAQIELDGDWDDAIRSDYSGRAMYGKTCVAVDLPGVADLAPFSAALTASVLTETANNGQNLDADVQRVMSMVRATRIDGHGAGIVAYWPGWTLTD